MTLKKKYKQNIEDHFIELHKKLSALQSEHLKKIMNYITHGDTNMTPKPTFETVPVTFESDKSWMDCDKCDVHSPCAEHSVDESEKWREEFDSGDFFLHSELAVDMTTVENIDLVDSKKLKDFISNLLTKERNKLLNQLLKEAPEDKEFTLNDDSVFPIWAEGFNEANKQWKELLTKHI